jgi:hypothetical protein
MEAGSVSLVSQKTLQDLPLLYDDAGSIVGSHAIPWTVQCKSWPISFLNNIVTSTVHFISVDFNILI